MGMWMRPFLQVSLQGWSLCQKDLHCSAPSHRLQCQPQPALSEGLSAGPQEFFIWPCAQGLAPTSERDPCIIYYCVANRSGHGRHVVGSARTNYQT